MFHDGDSNSEEHCASRRCATFDSCQPSLARAGLDASRASLAAHIYEGWCVEELNGLDWIMDDVGRPLRMLSNWRIQKVWWGANDDSEESFENTSRLYRLRSAVSVLNDSKKISCYNGTVLVILLTRDLFGGVKDVDLIVMRQKLDAQGQDQGKIAINFG